MYCCIQPNVHELVKTTAAYFTSDVRWYCAKQLKSIITFKKHHGPIIYKHIILSTSTLASELLHNIMLTLNY